MSRNQAHMAFLAAVSSIVLLAVVQLRPVSAQSAAPDGAVIFASTCAACHQATGLGIPGAFPPLAGHVGELFAAEGGQRYLASVVLFGLQGAITVNEETYNGVMPSFFSFSDAEIAAVLDHAMTAFGDAETLANDYVPITEADVADARGGALSPELVHQRRPDLGGAVQEPTAELALASFTADQVENVRATYDRLCLECHGSDLTGGLIGGPPLAGFVFRQKWAGKPLAPLFQYMSTQMPQGSPGSLAAQRYADLLALILATNGHLPGDKPLTPGLDELSRLTVRPN